MTREEFITLREEAIKREGTLLLVKGAEYHDNDDALQNFNEDAEVIGITPVQVWACHFLKQVRVIMRWARTGQDSVEGIESRFDDTVNYAHLGLAIRAEGKHDDDRG